MTNKMAFLLALAASVLSLANNLEKKGKTSSAHIVITTNR